MSVDLKVPSMGESVMEVEVGDWLKGEGEAALRDEPVVVLDSDKATMELPAPVSGTVIEILKKKGDVVQVGDVLGRMEEGDVKPAGVAAGAAEAALPAQAPAGSGAGREPRVMPAARRVLAQHGLAADDVEGTGPGGRVLKEDAVRQAEQRTSAAPAIDVPAVPGPLPADREEEVVPMSRMRRRIAERLVDAQRTAALLTTFNEIDMSEVIALRKRHKQAFIDEHGVKLGFMSFFVKAAVDALKQTPAVNAEVRDDAIVYKNYFDIGIAVGGGRGLVVPVVRSAETLGFAQIELAIADLARRARENQLTPDELTGGTFTISNGGVYGSMMSTPIVNPPQTAILGLHAIKDRPVAEDGEVVVRPMMYVALTYDHRVIDGRESVMFLKRIKETIEEPSRLLLEI
ncbi:MAG: 2-oxoglutarate dehydrogenase complex dihydrolipoyllysine-residue succinyltransferase [Acidobacteriota bacterium]|nr:2-oxoglutarate dehydrogenase complex dihydrolipoyllysine-residue succinyltransferase [Acidobacteriota bacterium]